ncbi:hypothetical protein F511_28986 [Dorcoceras hygrometricum]|uniref:Uncharacterized protein n=1 Tax=Dorcoceras hygrometricum TaxID=472368 RepID=A0A2Z7BXT0_9LAMI|nr:hypothetical protein F511_28986 [Dorcoceras hygrometricum]
MLGERIGSLYLYVGTALDSCRVLRSSSQIWGVEKYWLVTSALALVDGNLRGWSNLVILSYSGTLFEYPARVTKHRRLEEIGFEMRKLLALCELAWFEGLVWTGFEFFRLEDSAMSFWKSVNAGHAGVRSGHSDLSVLAKERCDAV